MSEDYLLLKNKLYEALLSRKGLQNILDVGREVIGNPMILGDNGFKILATSKSGVVRDNIWENIVERGFCSYDDVKLIVDDGLVDTVAKSSQPFFARMAYHQHNWIISKVVIDGKPVGVVSVIEYDRPFMENDLEMVQFLCEIIAFELQQNSSFNKTRGRIYEYLLSDILREQITDPDTIQERLKYLNINLMEYLFILSVRESRNTSSGLPIQYTRDVLEELINGCGLILGEEVILLVSRKKASGLTSDEMTKLSHFLSDNHLVGGISRFFQDITQVKDFYAQSSKAIDFGLKHTPHEVLFWYEDFSTEHMFDVVSRAFDVQKFCKPVLYKLIEHDKKNNSEYLNDLEVYLSTGNNRNHAAQLLNIHRNTMDYRLNKIEDLLQIQVDEPEVAFALNLSLRIWHFSQGTESKYLGHKPNPGLRA